MDTESLKKLKSQELIKTAIARQKDFKDKYNQKRTRNEISSFANTSLNNSGLQSKNSMIGTQKSLG